MEYAAIALAILGFAIGAVFRWKVLLPLIALLVVACVAFSLAHGYSFFHTALTIIVAQAILQANYFLGLAIRALFERARHRRPIL